MSPTLVMGYALVVILSTGRGLGFTRTPERRGVEDEKDCSTNYFGDCNDALGGKRDSAG